MNNKQTAKKLVQDYYRRLDSASDNRVEELLVDIMHPEVLWRGYHPFNEQVGPKAVAEQFWNRLVQKQLQNNFGDHSKNP